MMKLFTRLFVLVCSIVMLSAPATAQISAVEVFLAGGSTTDGDSNWETIAGVENSSGSGGMARYVPADVFPSSVLSIPRESPEGYAYLNEFYDNQYWMYWEVIPYSWITLNNPTTLSLGDDQMSSSIDLGFNTLFFGSLQNHIRVCSNGFITFSDTTTCPYTAQNLPDPTAPNSIVVGWWEDLLPASAGGTGTIKYQFFQDVYGEKQWAVIEFNGVGHYGNLNDKVTFQIVLTEYPYAS
ncbi:MAG: hypothetical protein Q8R47_06360 [Nanoarchaeota archaeon]|nr:hypothetical protein [Nanoarchaeota archaeon]